MYIIVIHFNLTQIQNIRLKLNYQFEESETMILPIGLIKIHDSPNLTSIYYYNT